MEIIAAEFRRSPQFALLSWNYCSKLAVLLIGCNNADALPLIDRSLYKPIKRGFDLLLALGAILLLSPLLTALALWVKLSSPGPVLYRGIRIGFGGKPFELLKFRTMVVDAERLGGSSTSADDPRITRAGHFLRRYKLDELPQLLNVFRGDMSFVGPRPQVRWAVDLYTTEERELLVVRPGITDYASLKYRDEGEILRGAQDPDQAYLELIAPGKIRLGLYYVAHSSLWTDCLLLVATTMAVFGHDPTWCLPSGERQPAATALSRTAFSQPNKS
ncbi:MAG: sugar transferase [Gemmatimonadales bacterium]|nr:sugar transferase [Gemmatimonadales bacterium]